jgi:hypothetical protein
MGDVALDGTIRAQLLIDSIANDSERQFLDFAANSPYLISNHIQGDNVIIVPQFMVNSQHLVQNITACLGFSSDVHSLLAKERMS